MKKYFSPRLLAIHAIAISVVITCLLLAQWQWHRAHYVRATQSSSVDSPRAFSELSKPKDYLPPSSIGVHTFVEGRWQVNGRFYLTNRPVDGRLLIDSEEHQTAMRAAKLGSWVIDLLQLSDKTSVAVVRGWVPAGTELPKVLPNEQSENLVTMNGVVQPSEDSPGMKLISTDQQLTTSLILHHSTSDVRDGFIIATDTSSNLVNIIPTREPATTTALHWRNVVYVFNWILFALLAVAMWFRVVRDETQSISSHVHT